jgi:cytochrome P450
MHKPRAMVTALVLYSPYLTHRDPGLWPDPLTFRPGRFQNGAAAWSFIPFAAGERTCLGRSFAQLVLSTVLAAVRLAECSRRELIAGTADGHGLR